MKKFMKMFGFILLFASNFNLYSMRNDRLDIASELIGKEEETGYFHIGAIITAITGKMLCAPYDKYDGNGVGQLYVLARYITGNNYMTISLYKEGLPKSGDVLDKQFPGLKNVVEQLCEKTNFNSEGVLNNFIKQVGIEYFEIPEDANLLSAWYFMKVNKSEDVDEEFQKDGNLLHELKVLNGIYEKEGKELPTIIVCNLGKDEEPEDSNESQD